MNGASRRGLLLATAAVAAIVVLAVFGLARERSRVSGRRAPALPRESLVGARVGISNLLASAHGHAALIVFWASWCGPCAGEAPALERFALSPHGRGRIVGVDWSDALSGARAFVRRFAWTFPNLRDGEGTVGAAYHLTGLPTTFVIDSHGSVRATLRGPQTDGSLKRALATVERS